MILHLIHCLLVDLKTIAEQAEGEQESMKTEDTESQNEDHAEEDVKWKDQAESGLKQMETELSKADNVEGKRPPAIPLL